MSPLSFREHPSAQHGILHRLQCWMSVSPSPSMGCSGRCPWAAGISQLWHLKHFFPSFTDFPVCGVISHTYFYSLCSLTDSAMQYFAFSPGCFLKASPAPLLELPGVSSTGQPLALPHRDQHCRSTLYYQFKCTIQNLTLPSQKWRIAFN